MTNKQTRRDILRMAGVGAVLAGAGRLEAADEIQGKKKLKPKFELGMTSYTFRQFPVDQAIAMTNRLGLKYICFKSMHLPLDSNQEQINETLAKVKEAGLELYACGVIYMNTADEVQQAFDYAKMAGIGTFVGVPKYDLLGLVDKKVKEYDIRVAIHNHGPGDQLYPTPQSVYERIKDLDKRIGLCIDVGHTQRIGIDPSEAVETYVGRLMDLHIKDVSSATAQGTTIEMGRGVIDIIRLMRTLIRIGYSGKASFEFEKDEKDPLPGVAESVGYTRGVLASL